MHCPPKYQYFFEINSNTTSSRLTYQFLFPRHVFPPAQMPTLELWKCLYCHSRQCCIRVCLKPLRDSRPITCLRVHHNPLPANLWNHQPNCQQQAYSASRLLSPICACSYEPRSHYLPLICVSCLPACSSFACSLSDLFIYRSLGSTGFPSVAQRYSDPPFFVPLHKTQIPVACPG